MAIEEMIRQLEELEKIGIATGDDCEFDGHLLIEEVIKKLKELKATQQA